MKPSWLKSVLKPERGRNRKVIWENGYRSLGKGFLWWAIPMKIQWSWSVTGGKNTYAISCFRTNVPFMLSCSDSYCGGWASTILKTVVFCEGWWTGSFSFLRIYFEICRTGHFPSMNNNVVSFTFIRDYFLVIIARGFLTNTADFNRISSVWTKNSYWQAMFNSWMLMPPTIYGTFLLTSSWSREERRSDWFERADGLKIGIVDRLILKSGPNFKSYGGIKYSFLTPSGLFEA